MLVDPRDGARPSAWGKLCNQIYYRCYVGRPQGRSQTFSLGGNYVIRLWKQSPQWVQRKITPGQKFRGTSSPRICPHFHISGMKYNIIIIEKFRLLVEDVTMFSPAYNG